MRIALAISVTTFTVALLTLSVSAQNGVLTGNVIDSENRTAVSYAHVSIDSAAFGTVSLEDGSFVVAGIPSGSHHVAISRIGYAKKVFWSVQIKDHDSTRLDISLTPEAFIADQIVVTASRKTQALNLAPASAVIITSKQLEQKQIQTFDQAMDGIPGVVVTRSSGSNVQSLSIRGASETAGGGVGNRVLLLIDGRPALSPESGGALWNLVPLNSLERIEVVKGAYSALFGSSAVGGVINAITRKPSDEADTRIHVSYGIYGNTPPDIDYNEFGGFSAIEFSHSKRAGKISYLIDAGRKHNDGHRQKSGFTLYNFYGKIQYELAPNRTIQVAGNFNKINNDTPATWLSPAQPYEVAEHRLDDFQSKREGSLDIYYNAITNNKLKYSSRFYYYQNLQEFTFNDDPLNDSTNVNTGKQFIDESVIHTKRLGNVSQVDWAVSDKHYALAGIDIKFDKTVGLPEFSLYGRHNAFEFGAYVQDEWSISDEFTITAGARLDYYSIIDEFSEFSFSPKVAFVYALNSSLSIRGLYARAFRNPSIAERFIKFEQGGGLSFKPNPDLVSEKLTSSFEIGMKYSPIDNLTFDLSLYHNRFKDLISFVQISAPLEPLTFMVVNLKTATMQGVEIALNYRPCQWFGLRAGYALLDARDTSPDRYNDVLAYKPKHTFSFSADFKYRNFNLYLSSRGRSEIEEVFIYPDSKPDAYMLIDAKLMYSILDKHQVYFSVNNIQNTQYEELERYRMAGRSFSTGIYFRF